MRYRKASELKIRKACSNVRADQTGREVIRTIGKVAAAAACADPGRWDRTDGRQVACRARDGTFSASDVGVRV